LHRAALIAGLSAAHLVLPVNTRRVRCIEVGSWPLADENSENSPPLSPALAAAVGAWREQGKDACCTVVPGAAFWQIAEAEDCPALRAATMQLLMESGDDNA